MRREPGGQRDDDDLGHQVGGRDPAAVVDAGADRALDVGQRGVDDLDVEDRHERAERRGDDGDPGLELEPWARRQRATAGMAASRNQFTRVSMVGSADMPGRSRPLSRLVVEGDLHRHALDDLGEVAGRVVGRQQRELEAAGRRQAVDMAVQHLAGEGVDLDRRPSGPAARRRAASPCSWRRRRPRCSGTTAISGVPAWTYWPTRSVRAPTVPSTGAAIDV